MPPLIHTALINNNDNVSAPGDPSHINAPLVEVKLEAEQPPLQPHHHHHHDDPLMGPGIPQGNSGLPRPPYPGFLGSVDFQTGAMPQTTPTAAMQALLLQQQQQILGNVASGLQAWPGWPQHPHMMQQQQQQLMMQQVSSSCCQVFISVCLSPVNPVYSHCPSLFLCSGIGLGPTPHPCEPVLVFARRRPPGDSWTGHTLRRRSRASRRWGPVCLPQTCLSTGGAIKISPVAARRYRLYLSSPCQTHNFMPK